MNVAVCLTGTLRAVKTCVPTLYKNIVDVLDADIFVCCNREHDDDDERIKLIQHKLITYELSYQEDLNTSLPPCFWETHYKFASEKIKETDLNKCNYLSPIIGSHTSLYYRFNWYRLSNLLEKYVSNYDFYIVTRPDHYYTFPIFDKSLLYNNSDVIIKYDNHDWNGLNVEFLIIPQKYILDWLRCHLKYLVEPFYINLLIEKMKEHKTYNSEFFTKCVADFEKFKFKTMCTNSFISADNLNEKTSFARIQKDEETQLLFKYFNSQFFPSMEYKKMWENNHQWVDDSNKLFLQ